MRNLSGGMSFKRRSILLAVHDQKECLNSGEARYPSKGKIGELRNFTGRNFPSSINGKIQRGLNPMKDDIQRIQELDEENPEIKNQLPKLYKEVVEQVVS